MGQPDRNSTDCKNTARGTEVFVGGLPRTISEEKIREVFSSCGEIVEIRLIKDQKDNLKGFCFVRFATKESASRAVREISGTVLDGKKIGVLPSSEQETLYFGNLNKAWSADEFKRIVLQIFPDIESIDLPTLSDMPPGQKQRNRGFAFVKFSSHAAAARAQRVGSQPDFRLGNLHPAVQWAEEEPEIDPKELAQIKVAFVRNLPADAEENYLKQLFEPFGKVEKVVVSKRGSSSIGFVHFTERSELERAVKELHDKTVQGRTGGQMHKLQVEVARPMDRNKKRVRGNSEISSSVQDHSKLLKSNIHSSHVHRELETVDPYEDAVIALPLAVKERLLRILRLGIATRFDIDIKSLCTLKGLPESIAISVLDQFMLSGASSLNKGAFLAGLISKHLVDKVASGQSLTSLSKVEDTSRNEYKLLNFSHRLSSPAVGPLTSHALSSTARSDIYEPCYPSLLPDYHLSSRTVIGRAEEKGSLLCMQSLSGSQSMEIPRVHTLEERSYSPLEASPGPGQSIYYGRIGVRTEEQRPSPIPSSSTFYASLGMNSSSDTRASANHQPTHPITRAVADYQPSRPDTRAVADYQPIRPDTRAVADYQPTRPDTRAVSDYQPTHPVTRAVADFQPTRPDTRAVADHQPARPDIRGVADQQPSRPQMRFDPFTGEPYKFDPFTGEPIIHPGNTRSQF